MYIYNVTDGNTDGQKNGVKNFHYMPLDLGESTTVISK